MAITSEEIHNQSFTVARKGYDVDEVDVFLEHVAAEIDDLNAVIDNLNARLAQYEGQDGYLHGNALDMDAAFAEPARPEQLANQDAKNALLAANEDKDARIAELERQLAEKESDASAIANALVTAQRSAKEVVNAAQEEAKRIHDNAEADADDIIERANAERAKIENAIDELDRSHKEICMNYSDVLKSFIEDANRKLDDIEDELAKNDGKKRAHARFASPAQAPVYKPEPVGATGAVAPSYTTPAMPDSAVASVMPSSPASSATIKPSKVEKDLSGYGDASDAFDLGDID